MMQLSWMGEAEVRCAALPLGRSAPGEGRSRFWISDDYPFCPKDTEQVKRLCPSTERYERQRRNLPHTRLDFHFVHNYSQLLQLQSIQIQSQVFTNPGLPVITHVRCTRIMSQIVIVASARRRRAGAAHAAATQSRTAT